MRKEKVASSIVRRGTSLDWVGKGSFGEVRIDKGHRVWACWGNLRHWERVHTGTCRFKYLR